MQNYIVFPKVASTAIVQASNPKVAEKKWRKKYTAKPEETTSLEVVVVPWSFAKLNGMPIYKCKQNFDTIDTNDRED